MLLILVLLGACSGTEEQPGPPVEPPPPPESFTKEVGVEGGVLKLSDGATLTVPRDALESDVQVTMALSEEAPPAELGRASRLYEFKPAGVVFNRPVTVSIPITDAASPPTLYWSTQDGSGYEPLGGVVENGHLVARVVHFSKGFVGQSRGSRTVMGVARTTWLTEHQVRSLPNNVERQGVSALVLGANGLFREYPGRGNSADGVFSVPNVPRGPLYLRVGTTYLLLGEGEGEGTGIDLGRARAGRPEVVMPARASPLSFSVSGLVPWQRGDQLEFFSVGANSWFFYLEGQSRNPPTVGATSLSDMTVSSTDVGLIDGGQGDRGILAQLSRHTSTTGVPYSAMSRLVEFPAFTQVEGETTRLVGEMLPVETANSAAFRWRLRDFHRYTQDSIPNPERRHTFLVVQGLPSDNSRGMYSSSADYLLISTQRDDELLETGTLNYGSPLQGRWATSVLAHTVLEKNYQLPGTTRGVTLRAGMETIDNLDDAQAHPLTPRLSPVRNPRVNGVSLFQPATGVTPTPVVTWDAPELGTPRLYQLSVLRIRADAENVTRVDSVGAIYTRGRSITVPPGLMLPGYSYVLVINASLNETSTPNEPFRDSIPSASATVVGAMLEMAP
ncbi:hypothetical protein NVS55_05145 [Myxococcus stipitatus]|uniref:hypothetical protein n=1 Tax=Myxococcus stipitatus TaxID=83455 RepID=UPI003145238A